MRTQPLLTSGLIACVLCANTATAGVKFRLDYDANNKEYVVYMTSDSVPNPDMVLSSQVSVVVPHMVDTNRFDVLQINSAINGITWLNHLRVDAPKENAAADYLSFGLFFQGGKPPSFGWEANKEKRIFSFTSNRDCIAGVGLLNNNDPFNQLPNSVDTNPGNEFSNIGWVGGNMYTGNYGASITCGNSVKKPVCEKSKEKIAGLNGVVNVMSALLSKMSNSTQRDNMQKKLEELRGLLTCKQ